MSLAQREGHINLGGIQDARIPEKVISRSVLGEMGHVRISGKLQTQICLGGNGTCPDSGKSVLPDLFGGIGYLWISGKVYFKICLGGIWACPDPRKKKLDKLPCLPLVAFSSLWKMTCKLRQWRLQ